MREIILMSLQISTASLFLCSSSTFSSFTPTVLQLWAPLTVAQDWKQQEDTLPTPQYTLRSSLEGNEDAVLCIILLWLLPPPAQVRLPCYRNQATDGLQAVNRWKEVRLLHGQFSSAQSAHWSTEHYKIALLKGTCIEKFAYI